MFVMLSDVKALYLILQVVGSRGSLDFDPRLTMSKELTIAGIALASGSQVIESHGCPCLNINFVCARVLT